MEVVTRLSVESTPGVARMSRTTTFESVVTSSVSMSSTRSQRPNTAVRCETPLISLMRDSAVFSLPAIRRTSTNPVTILAVLPPRRRDARRRGLDHDRGDSGDDAGARGSRGLDRALADSVECARGRVRPRAARRREAEGPPARLFLPHRTADAEGADAGRP